MTRPRNDNFLRALLRQPTDYTPIWLMRQAGRYLPEYCETRRRAGSFLALCKNPSLACEVTMQPLARYDLDAAILFSDILTIPDAMGLGLSFSEGEGPRFERPLREEWAIRDLAVPDPYDHLRYVTDAVAEIRRALDNSVPLIGFSGSPYTLACYMVEGGSSTEFRHIKRMLYARPDLLHHILSINADAVTAYLNAQVESGAQALMIFDSWGGNLSQAAYREFSLAYLRQILAGLIRERDGERIPVIVFTKGGGLWLEDIADSGCDAIGLDWAIELSEARRAPRPSRRTPGRPCGCRCVSGSSPPAPSFRRPRCRSSRRRPRSAPASTGRTEPGRSASASGRPAAGSGRRASTT